jgi:hypothetical protein
MCHVSYREGMGMGLIVSYNIEVGLIGSYNIERVGLIGILVYKKWV